MEKLSTTCLIILFQAFGNVIGEQCFAGLYCNKCISNVCTQCFSYVGGPITPRILDTGNCFTKRTNNVDNCRVYSNTDASSVCEICKSGYQLEIVEAADGSLTYYCGKFDKDYMSLSHCFQTVKKTKSDGTVAQYCKYCSKPYTSGKLDVTESGAEDCQTKEDVIAFCQYNMRTASGNHCWACQNGYVLTSDSSRCVRHKDINCRQTIDPIGHICGSCWFGFYWEQNLCIMKSLNVIRDSIQIIGTLVVVITILIY